MPQKIRDAEQQAAEVVGIGNRIGEEIAQQHLDENIGSDDADKECRDPFDRIDETIHVDAFHARSAVAQTAAIN